MRTRIGQSQFERASHALGVQPIAALAQRCRSCHRVQGGGRRIAVASLARIARRRTLGFRLCDARWLIEPALRQRATAERSLCEDWKCRTRTGRETWRHRSPARVARRLTCVRGEYRCGRGFADIWKVSATMGVIVSRQASD